MRGRIDGRSCHQARLLLTAGHLNHQGECVFVGTLRSLTLLHDKGPKSVTVKNFGTARSRLTITTDTRIHPGLTLCGGGKTHHESGRK
jgi:hypothetical protein